MSHYYKNNNLFVYIDISLPGGTEYFEQKGRLVKSLQHIETKNDTYFFSIFCLNNLLCLASKPYRINSEEINEHAQNMLANGYPIEDLYLSNKD